MAVDVCRRLVEAGAQVAPVLTTDATRFVSPLTFSALATEPARSSLWDAPEPIPHTHLGQWAELIVVAPATARVLAAYAAGLSDDLLIATLLATRSPVMVCPAMHTEMWEHPAVRDNLETLRRRGVRIVPPGVGRLAGGDEGPGRLAEPDQIVAAATEALSGSPGRQRDLVGLHVLVTAGGTREPIDPVRYIGNRSSGKQGHAIADEAVMRGAIVTLVTAANLPGPPESAEVVRVDTAGEMEEAVLGRAANADIVIMAAAVADFRPKVPAEHKLKKAEGVPEIVLEPTVDILAGLARRRPPKQLLVGFAAETAGGVDLVASARDKLLGKNLDLVVANDVSAPDAGFEHDSNAVVVVAADGAVIELPVSDKRAIAGAILDVIAERRPDRSASTAADRGAGTAANRGPTPRPSRRTEEQP
jgi:phosphopantothenoylcysteine decarboxylase/phosphopantothenate--cysteine ligase